MKILKRERKKEMGREGDRSLDGKEKIDSKYSEERERKRERRGGKRA